MTRRELQMLGLLLIVCGIAGLAATVALYWAIDAATESQRPDTPILNASAAR